MQRLLNLKVESVEFVRADLKRTRKWVDCWVSFSECQTETRCVGKASWAKRQKHSNWSNEPVWTMEWGESSHICVQM